VPPHSSDPVLPTEVEQRQWEEHNQRIREETRVLEEFPRSHPRYPPSGRKKGISNGGFGRLFDLRKARHNEKGTNDSIDISRAIGTRSSENQKSQIIERPTNPATKNASAGQYIVSCIPAHHKPAPARWRAVGIVSATIPPSFTRVSVITRDALRSAVNLGLYHQPAMVTVYSPGPPRKAGPSAKMGPTYFQNLESYMSAPGIIFRQRHCSERPTQFLDEF